MDLQGNFEADCPACGTNVHSYQTAKGVYWVEHHERPWRGHGPCPKEPRLCPVGGMPWPYLMDLQRARERKAAAQGRFDTILAASKRAGPATMPPKDPPSGGVNIAIVSSKETQAT